MFAKQRKKKINSVNYKEKEKISKNTVWTAPMQNQSEINQ